MKIILRQDFDTLGHVGDIVDVKDGYARNYPGSVKEIRKALRVNTAFQRVLDDPAAAEALQHPALAPLLAEAAD